MNILSTIRSLYAIRCEADLVCSDKECEKGRLRSLLQGVSDEDVSETIDNVQWLLGELATVTESLKGMYILHYTTGTDKDNKHVIITTECVFGTKTVKFSTQFDIKAAQGLVDAINWQLALIKGGDRLAEGGNA